MQIASNLLAALKRLRPTKSLSGVLKKGKLPWKSRLLWIDTLCINQDDIAERSDQVKLMADIYRNSKRTLVWIGKEPPLAKESFRLISMIAKVIEHLDLNS